MRRAFLAFVVAAPLLGDGAQTEAQDNYIRASFEVTLGASGTSGQLHGFDDGTRGSTAMGELDPRTFSAFGQTHTIHQMVRREETGDDDLAMAVSPCPDAWTLDSLSAGGNVYQGFSEACDETTNAARFTIDDAVPDADDPFATNGETVIFTLRSLNILGPGAGGFKGEGQTKRDGLRATMCSMPDYILGEGYCGPLRCSRSPRP